MTQRLTQDKSRLALTGASGFLGAYIANEVLAGGGQLLSLTRRSNPIFISNPDYHEQFFTLSDDQLAEQLVSFNPRGVIHAAAQSSAAICEQHPVQAHESNVVLSQRIFSLCARLHIPVCYVSSDLVFDGVTAPFGGFVEGSQPLPVSVYSQSKYTAECEALRYPLNSVVRISLLVGKALGDKRGSLVWMEEKFANNSVVELFSDEWRTPIGVRDAARFLIAVVQQKMTGIYHCAGAERLSRVEFGKRFAVCRKYNQHLICQVKRAERQTVPARPEDVSLNCTWSMEKLGFVRQPLENSLS